MNHSASNIIWFGYAVEEYWMEYFKNNYGKLMSAQKSQRAILDGITKCLGRDICTYNVLPFPNYPNCQLLNVPEDSYTNDDVRHVSLGFCNKKFVDRISKARSFAKAGKKAACIYDAPIAVAYGMTSYTMSALKAVKKSNPKSITALIITDLPQYMDLSMGYVKRVLKAIDWHQIKSLMKYVDKFILYAAPMAEYLNIPNEKWMLMEGLFDVETYYKQLEMPLNTVSEDDEKIIVMYSGLLEIKYGIDLLCDGFSMLEGDCYELWITGNGHKDCEDYIRNASKKDSRIKFFGYLESYAELLRMQRRATMLVNMRLPSEPASNYCFPSKLFDYMTAGKPVLTCRLGGIPDEYYQYLIEIKNISKEGIAEAIKSVTDMSDDEYERLGEMCRMFVLDKKGNLFQSDRILKFLENKND